MVMFYAQIILTLSLQLLCLTVAREQERIILLNRGPNVCRSSVHLTSMLMQFVFIQGAKNTSCQGTSKTRGQTSKSMLRQLNRSRQGAPALPGSTGTLVAMNAYITRAAAAQSGRRLRSGQLYKGTIL